MSESIRARFPSTRAIIGIVVLVLLTIGTGMVGCPIYNVWSAQKAGEAELAQADQNRQIAVAQARAKAESAHFEADAEITRAEGVPRQRDHRQKPAGQRGLPALSLDQWVGAEQERGDLRADRGQPAYPGSQPSAPSSDSRSGAWTNNEAGSVSQGELV